MPCMFVRHLFQEKGAKRRHEGERKDERAKQRKRNGESKRAEHLSFEPFKGEERQEDDDDNGNAEDNWPAHLLGGIKHGLDFAGVAVVRFTRIGFLGEATVNIFHHHDGAIHHHEQTKSVKMQRPGQRVDAVRQ